MPIFEIQLVETKQSSQYDMHIHLRVGCEARKQSYVYVLGRVGMGTIPELSLRKVGILTLPGEVRIPTWHGSIPELSLHKVGIGTK